MKLAGHRFICAIALAATVAGCAAPFTGRPSPDAGDGGEYQRLIHVDREGNVSHGPKAAAAVDPPRPQASLPPKKVDKILSESPNDTAADPQPSVNASAVEEHLKRQERATRAQAAAKPVLVQHLAEPPRIPEGVTPTVVRTKRFTLEYDDAVLGPDGIARVELYGTKDNGRTWQRLGEDLDRRSPYEVVMDTDGLFGFRIAVAGKNGLASEPPQDGELPELWVKVDSTAPAFHGHLRASAAKKLNQTRRVEDQPRGPQKSDAQVATPKPAETVKKQTPPEVSQASLEAPAAEESWRESLSRSIASIESELAGKPETSDSDGESPPKHALTDQQRATLAAQLRMLQIAAGRHEAAIRSSPHHSTEENEYWSHQMHSLHLLLEGDEAMPRSRQQAAALAQLREASDRLAAVSQLQISNLAFCTSAQSFGVYETSIEGGNWKHNDYRQAKFEPEQPVVLYFEVDNFTSAQHTSREYPDGAWRTSLKGTYTILDLDGRPLQRRELKLRDDICRNRRHDYFVAYKTWMPKLNPGRYTLELLIEDALAEKIGTSTIDFEIVSR